MPRGTLAGQLAAMGFADTTRARQLLTDDLGLDPDGADAPLVEALAGAADPDLALAALARMAPDDELRAALRADEELRDRLVTVLGVSAALGDHLARQPGDWRLLAGPAALARPAAGELAATLLAATRSADRDPAAGLRLAYRRRLLHLAARDLTGADPLDSVMAELADLAAAALLAALAIAQRPARARPARGPRHPPPRPRRWPSSPWARPAAGS